MIIPSIDLMDGHAVQLVGGREKAIDAGDPRPIAERFRLAGTLAVIDLDAALGRGSNAGVIRDLLRLAPCRVGGGIRTVEAALDWLDAGAEQVILGTAAVPELLEQLPRERVVAALDADRDDVMVEGWRRATGRSRRRPNRRTARVCERISWSRPSSAKADWAASTAIERKRSSNAPEIRRSRSPAASRRRTTLPFSIRLAPMPRSAWHSMRDSSI